MIQALRTGGAGAFNWAKSNPGAIASRGIDAQSFARANTKLDYLLSAASAVNPYLAVLAFGLGNMQSAHQEWNNLPENHPLKIKHRNYIKRAKKAQKQERVRARRATGEGHIDAALHAAAEKDAKNMINHMMKKGGSFADYFNQPKRSKACPGCH